MSSAMLRRSAVEETGGIPEHVTVVPDYYLFVAIARRSRARAVQEVVCRYRVHSGSMSASPQLRRLLQSEPLSIVNQWAAQMPPDIAKYRRMTYSSALALEDMRETATFMQGLLALLRDGSVLWLASRPFVRGWRTIHRKLRRPYWTTGR
jgi:hypothetical protein